MDNDFEGRNFSVAYLCSQFETIKSGPGRYTEHLYRHKFSDLTLDIFTDDVNNSEDPRVHDAGRIHWLARLPFYWVTKNFLLYRAFRKVAKDRHFDAVLCNSTLESLYFAIFREKTPFLTMINDMDYSMNSPVKRWKSIWYTIKPLYRRLVMRRIENYISQHSFRVVINSKCNEKIVKEVYGLEDSKVALLYPCVDLSEFQFQPREFETPKNLLFVKSAWQIGGLDRVIEGLGKLRDSSEITLDIVGPKLRFKQELQTIADSSGFKGKLVLHGLLDKKELIRRYQQADLFVNMSRSEALGISLMEAMSCGTPVMAVDVGGISEVLEDGKSGFLIKDVEEFTEKMQHFLDNPGSVAEKVELGLASCRRFSVENIEQNFVRLFEGISKQA